MNISISIPEDLARQIETQWKDLPRRTLEALAVEAYRAGMITEAEVQRMLNLSSRWEVEEFLKRWGAYMDYTEMDLQQDIDTIRELLSV
ncbi:MAG: UPF0175 family protein [Nitrososphaera sp.]|nr:UPF0175 family protein [Nitrososphaera sp.]